MFAGVRRLCKCVGDTAGPRSSIRIEAVSLFDHVAVVLQVCVLRSNEGRYSSGEQDMEDDEQDEEDDELDADEPGDGGQWRGAFCRDDHAIT